MYEDAAGLLEATASKQGYGQESGSKELLHGMST